MLRPSEYFKQACVTCMMLRVQNYDVSWKPDQTEPTLSFLCDICLSTKPFTRLIFGYLMPNSDCNKWLTFWRLVVPLSVVCRVQVNGQTFTGNTWVVWRLVLFVRYVYACSAVLPLYGPHFIKFERESHLNRWGLFLIAGSIRVQITRWFVRSSHVIETLRKEFPYTLHVSVWFSHEMIPLIM